MCTAISYNSGNHYFGRNLDLDYSYSESVAVTPRNYPFTFRKAGALKNHYAMIGMAFVLGGYPLYYDATNEKGLSMAGLNFPGNADYKPETDGFDNITPFEFIPWILGQCSDISEAKTLLSKINLVNIPFSGELPLAPLHWMISDKNSSIVVESVREGLKIYENPAGVLTNNPPFGQQLFNLNNYMSLTSEIPQNSFSDKLDLQTYCVGMGALGLPGDPSSSSRFVKAAFTKLNSVPGSSEHESVGQFFHILGSVSQQRGCAKTPDGGYEITVYTSCCNTDKGIYYYTTYENSRISAVDMNKENLDGSEVVSYLLKKEPDIDFLN